MRLSSLNIKFYKLFHPAKGEVLMLHRVTNTRSALTPNRLLEISPEKLETTIVNYLQKGYDLISLDELEQMIVHRKYSKRPFVCFTLDDGYRDNFELAYPVFKKYNCPFAIYLTTDFPDHKALLWWYWLEDVLVQHDSLTTGKGMIPLRNREEKEVFFDQVRSLLFESENIPTMDVLQAVLPDHTDSLAAYAEKLALSWEQVKTLSQDKLCTIASHTTSHPVLTRLNNSRFRDELQGAKKRIEQEIQQPVNHFAYPYGIYNAEIVRAVQEAGYHTATIVNGGKVRREKRSALEIKRILLVQEK